MDAVVSPGCAPDGALATIPLIDGGTDATRALLLAEPARLAALVASARRHYGGSAMAVGDTLSRRWLRRTGNPYMAEIADAAARIGRPGAYLLNLSYEWTCTTAVGANGAGRMLRVLDWPLDGLGANVVVLRREGEAGSYYDVTWPGFAGTVTAMAPGRFSAAINQTPMPAYTSSCWLDWAIARLRGLARGLPPAHLLRRVFDTCRTYAEAKAMLAETPIAVGAFFSLAGTKPCEGVVVERTPDMTMIHASPVAVANDWIGIVRPGRPRGQHSRERRDLLARVAGDTGDDGFAWLLPPVLNPTTRIAAVADAADGTLVVRGFEERGRATVDFRL